MKHMDEDTEEVVLTKIESGGKQKKIIAKARLLNIEDQWTTPLSAMWSFYYNEKKFDLIDRKTGKRMEDVFLSSWRPKSVLPSEKTGDKSWSVSFSFLMDNHQDLFIDVHVTIEFDIDKMQALYHEETEITN
ncbi:MAG: hypothetical protein JW827_07625 [Spirochaetes bacterium]|nr:hypothetical protein [Spirochaetota bacterium]